VPDESARPRAQSIRTPERVVAPRPAVFAVFFALGATAGMWAARIPVIKAGLHLSAGALGLVLLGPAIGSMLAMPATGAILASVAPRRIVQAGLVAVAAMLPLTTFAGSAWQLFAALAGWGAGIGTVDVAMNTEAAAVQEHLGRTTMSSFHAAYSVGGLAGAGTGAIAAAADMSARANFTIGSAIILAAGVASAQVFASRPAPPAAHHPHRRARWPAWSWTLACLALVAFGSFLAEGAASDWSAVYLHGSLRASPAVAAIGYTVFSVAMVAGRLAGDRLTDWAGPVRLVRTSAGVASVCFLAALLAGRAAAGLAGFAMLGIGLAVVVPTVFTAASRLGAAGPNLAFVTSTGYLGMLAGPALIGGLAEAVGLPAALGTLVLITAMTALLAGAVAGPIRSRNEVLSLTAGARHQ
jgi:predicted MFS family arabinose efflux permease